MTREHTREHTYADAGVDIDEEDRAIKALAGEIAFEREGLGAPLTGIGHYAGLIDFGEYALAMATDGVGSKVIIASEMQKWDTVGIDCIAMNVNDLLAIGAEPIAFVDYLAVERTDPEMSRQIGKGLERGAKISNMSILGGETATLPEVIRGFDLAGTCLGMVKKDRIITGDEIRPGDAILGLPSSGIHSNGLTLARQIIRDAGYSYHDPFPYADHTIGEELLTPTRIYMEILDLIQDYDVHGLAHITGSGYLKLARISDHGYHIHEPLPVPRVFQFLQEEGNVSDLEMHRTFNMGMGFTVIMSEEEALEAEKTTDGRLVGEITEKQEILVDDLKITRKD